MAGEYLLEPLANYHCECGENPLWDADRGLVYWTDIPGKRLFRYEPRTGAHEQFYSGDDEVGGFTIQRDGSLLLFKEKRFSRLDPDGYETILVDGLDDAVDRFNDVIADPAGRVFAGTYSTDHELGGLFRVDPDGTFTCLFRGTGCSNGMGFSPDRRVFYWTCSTTSRIFRFDYDEATGEIDNREVLVALGKGEGSVDGMTVDSDGNIWSAIWDGYAIRRFSPSGESLDRIEFPVARVSSLIFGGETLDEFYVTTAGGSQGSDSADGTLYRVKVAARGLPEFRSAVMLR